MRPPDLPGGNTAAGPYDGHLSGSFNEAAGFTRRKHKSDPWERQSKDASMRPPDLPGGNAR